MSKAKCLLRSQRLLEQALTYAKRTKAQFFFFYIPTLHLHLVDKSGLFLPPEHWDPLNLVYFLGPDSYTVLNSRPSAHLGDILPGTPSTNRLAGVVEDYV